MMRARSGVLAAAVAVLASCAPAATLPSQKLGATVVASAAAASTPAPPYVMRQTLDGAFRAGPPPLGEEGSFTPPPIHTFRLANGIPVLFLEQHTVGLVRAEVMLRARPAPFGANAMAARTVWLGTPGAPETQLRNQNDADGALMTSTYAWGWIHVYATSTSDRASSSIARLATVVLGAAFPAGQYIPFAQRVMREIEPSNDAPQAIATRLQPIALYGSAHPEDDWQDLRSDDAGALRRDEVAQAYEAALDPTSAALVVAGDATETALRALLEKAFGGWRPSAKHARPAWPPLTPSATSARLVVVDRAGAESHFVFVGEGAKFATDDWAALVTWRLLLGSKTIVDGVSARLALSHNPRGARVAFEGNAPVDRTGAVLAAMDQALRQTRSAEMHAGDLQRVLGRQLVDAPSWTASLASEVSELEGLVVQGLPPDDIAKRGARIGALTVDDLRRAGARYLDPDRMKIVVIGDWSKIRPQLEALGWGPAELRDAAGQVAGGPQKRK
jgi:zinc protease